ncbi:TetR/AcrR family transcriptional regulator [Streptomyces sp. AK02-01A]|uniref:TetR/AcrR family transcriptional regulator n=1 Tax=Streptomyces sp. AK02-01A TaxID=3028648 RepID=UPI0029A153DA|nr:TetR/AcrR family transcriptional regulator [Streptomyces sp. AK02-01A]MDX3851982.1 TetR/AcrR family transcriptional regulator [Streptomyces sp. AK02-01A]
MVSSRSAATARSQPVSLRRRGPVLERAILDAALEQLSTVGWNGLTMEGVAAGAQTGKAAVYRRWSSKEELVEDALRAGLPTLGEAPDHGNVREDLYQLCKLMRDAMYSRPGFALRSVLHECDSPTAERFHELILSGVIEPSRRLFGEVVSRGISRGDVRPDATGELLFDVIPALMMYRSKVCASEWSDEEITEVIDQVMVPLLHAHTA